MVEQHETGSLTGQMQNHPIRIKGIVNGNDLDLSDKGKTIARSGESITWIIEPGSGVESIEGIITKTGSVNVFSSGPCRVGSSNNWKGTIMQVQKMTEEEYTIEYKKVNDNTVYSFDPVIQANP